MRSLSNKLIAVVIFAIALVSFNLIHKPEIKSEQEKRFEDWLTLVESGAEVNTGYPKLTLTIKEDSSGNMRMYQLNEDVSIEKRSRILGLLKEAKLKAAENDLRAIESSSASGSIKIQGSTTSFYFPFLKSDLTENIPAQTLLKLFQIYSQGNLNTANEMINSNG